MTKGGDSIIYKLSCKNGSLLSQYNIFELAPKKDKAKLKQIWRLTSLINQQVWFETKEAEKIFKWQLPPPVKQCITTGLEPESNPLIAIHRNPYYSIFFSKKGPIKIPKELTVPNFIDYKKKGGWLFSYSFLKKGKRVDAIGYVVENKVKKLCKGNFAVWGNDDYIYFIRGKSNLWRLSLKTKKEELVFKPRNVHFDGRSLYPPIFNNDKTLLVFPYQDYSGKYGGLRMSIIIFDFVNKEYRQVLNVGINANLFWINPTKE